MFSGKNSDYLFRFNFSGKLSRESTGRRERGGNYLVAMAAAELI
jgi:hypothetical protein